MWLNLSQLLLEKALWRRYLFSGTIEKPTEKTAVVDTKSVEVIAPREPLLNTFFRKYYGPFLMNPITKVGVILSFIAYLAISFYGCYRIKDGLQPDKLVLRSHFVHKYFDMMDDFWAEGMQAHIVVNNPPNLTIGENREKILNMVTRFENTSHTLASNATLFFLREYMVYLDSFKAKITNTTEYWEDKFQNWLSYTGGRSLWITDIKFGMPHLGEDPNEMKAFRFQVGIKDFKEPNDHMNTMDLLRSIASEYPEYNITTYHEYWPYADQYEMTKPTMLRDNITAIITMLAIALVLIPHLLCGVFITLAMITINIGIYGFMSLWGVNLDGVSMITLIMAIGFAIDLSAHISYAYVCAKGSPTDRTVSALEELGWPVFQGAFATILGVLVLATVDSYLIQTFFKTVLLVMVFGLLHSNVFLPVSLALFLPEKKLCQTVKTAKNESKTSLST